MPSTETYTAEALTRDAARVAELTEQARRCITDAAEVLDRIAEANVSEVSFTLGQAIRETAGDIASDIAGGAGASEVTPAQLAEYARDLVKLVELACEESRDDG